MWATLSRSLVVAAIAASTAALGAADVISQLGLTIDAVREAIGSVLTFGVNNPGLPSQAFKALTPAARGTVATAGVGWLKTYAASAEFKRQYAQLRETRKPEPPTWELTPEQEMQKADAESKEQLAASKAAIGSLPPDQRKAVEESLKGAQDLIAQMNTPEQRKMRLDAIKADRASRMKEYEGEVAKWRQDYPEDPKPIIVKRLRDFLQLSADVDFNARLKKTESGQFLFENPAYQAKSSQWKLCFRAGREATTAARASAQQWLTELGG
jgi:hypothetical protein